MSWENLNSDTYSDQCSNSIQFSATGALVNNNASSSATKQDASRKRKRSHGEEKSTRQHTARHITLYPIPHTGSSEPLYAITRDILPRARLPLSSLDPLQGFDSGIPRHVLAKEPLFEFDNDDFGPSILLAEIQGQDSLFAIEHYRQSLYSLSRLVQNFKIDGPTRYDHARDKTSRHLGAIDNAPLQRNSWWMEASFGEKVEAFKPDPLEQTCPPIQNSELATDELDEQVNPAPEAAATVSAIEVPLLQSSQQDQQDVLEFVVDQYLETLYLSKTSLAYFAKSTLSRARARASPSDVTALHLEDLGGRLKSMVLGPSMEKKYRETLPGMLQTLQSRESANAKTQKCRKRKSKKKAKLGKGGVYAHEQDYLSRWWSESISDVAVPVATAETIAQLRLREVMLQIILIMEVLALESSSRNASDGPIEANSKDTARIEKKSNELKSTLQGLVDWLSIWQSVNTLDSRPTAKENFQNGISDQGVLKEFCKEVMAPFYGARLPSVSKDVCRQLGVPLHSSPAPKKARKHKALTNTSGQSVRRKHSKFLVDKTNTFGRPTPSLKRSATDSKVRPERSERSSTPQSLIQSEKRERTLSRSNSVALGKSRSQREVDMSAMFKAKAKASKEIKESLVEQELKEAIATLKKPNRTLAAKEYFEDADKVLSSTSQVKKPVPTLQRPNLDVLVGATPKRSTKTKFLPEGTPRRLQPEKIGDIESFVPSSNPFVPMSAARPRYGNIVSIAEPEAHFDLGGTSTPSKPSSIGMVGVAASAKKESLQIPDAFRTMGACKNPEPIFKTPLKGAKNVGHVASSSPVDMVETPLSKMNATKDSRVQSVGSETGEKTSRSIYQALGWDDLELDDLA